jgi:nitrous-oxide reductase
MQVEPGETKTIRWVAERVGIQPFYCSNFCSALHQEMQGYIQVNPPGTRVAALQRPDPKTLEEVAAILKP